MELGLLTVAIITNNYIELYITFNFCHYYQRLHGIISNGQTNMVFHCDTFQYYRPLYIYIMHSKVV